MRKKFRTGLALTLAVLCGVMEPAGGLGMVVSAETLDGTDQIVTIVESDAEEYSVSAANAGSYEAPEAEKTDSAAQILGTSDLDDQAPVTVTFTLSGETTMASLSSESASGIAVTADATTGVTAVEITKAGEYTLTGTAKNTYVTVKKSITGVTLTLDGLTIDDSGLAAALGSDSPVISCGKNSEVTVVLTNTSALTGSSTFVKEPEAVVKASTATLSFEGTGSLNVTDPMASTTEFIYDGASVDPADAISAKTGTVNFKGGTVTVSANGSGVKAKQGEINVDGGTVIVTSSGDDAIKAKDGTINIKSGTVTVQSTNGDGLKAGMEETADGGNINISGGTVTIKECYGDGIQGENINISGGIVNIETVYNNAATGYYASGSSSTTLNTLVENEGSGTKTERINVDTGSHKGIKAGTKESTRIYSDLLESDPTTAVESIEASGGLTITGGTITVDTTGSGLKANSVTTSGYTATSAGAYIIGSPDDAIHSNNSINISGGTITVRSSDDGIGAADTITVTGNPTINIDTAYEGIEAGTIVIGTSGADAGPDITINSNDDGINASSKTVVYTYDSSEDTDCNYTKVSTSKSNNSCVVYSGKLVVKIDSENAGSVTLRNGSASGTKTVTFKRDGDGIDCNGSLDIEGGTVYVFGQSTGANSPLDHDTGFTLGSNATVLAAGSNSMSSESIPGYGTGVYITYGSSSSGGPGGTPPSGMTSIMAGPGGNTPGGNDNSGGGESASISAGSTFTVKNGSTTVFEETLVYAASFVLFASPELTSGTSYTVTIGSTSSTATATKPSSTAATAVTVSSVTLDKSTLTLDMGKNATLTATVATSGSSGGNGQGGPGGQSSSSVNVKWTSSDPSVAAVTGSGVVYAKKAGTATITATAGDKSATCTVTVNTTSVTGVTLSETAMELTVGANKELTATITPKYASNTALKWTSSDESVATVADGTVTALKAGSTIITAETTDGTNLKATCTVTVTNAVKTTITLDQTELKLAVGKEGTLTATVVTEDGSVPEVTWTSSASSTVSVTADQTGNQKAVLKGLAKGTATISATANGVSASCKVNVYIDTESIDTQGSTDAVDYSSGQDDQIIAKESAESTAEAPVYAAEMVKGQKSILGTGSWSSSASKIVAVAKKTGVVTAKKAGTAVITDAVTNTKYQITVYEPVLPVKKVILLVGNESGEITLNNTGALPVSWISANPAVATVSEESDGNGSSAAVITAVGRGSTKILAYAGGKSYAISVVVKDLAVSTKLVSTAEVTLNAFQTYALKFTDGFKPSGAAWTDEAGNALTQDAKGNWSDADGIVTISKAGKVTGTAVGEVTIVGTDKNSRKVTLTISVKAIPVKTDLYLNVGGKTTLKHTYVKQGTIVWTVGDSSVASLTNTDKAKVTVNGLAAGETTLTCTCNGVTYETTVHVEDPSVDGLTPAKAGTYNYTLTLKKGEVYVINQSNVEQAVVFKSSKKKTAFVSEYGIIYAREKGSAVISAKVNGKAVKIKLTVTE